MKKNILVVGGTGFIGSQVIYQLLQNNEYEVYSFSRHKNSLCSSFVGNVMNKTTLDVVFKSIPIDVCLILYGLKSVADSSQISIYTENDLEGMINILNVCLDNGCTKVVYLSSGVVYQSGIKLTETSPTESNSLYSMLKLTNENLLFWYKQHKNLNYVILRIFNVCGFSSIGKVSNDVISLILNRKKLDVYGIDYDTPDGTLIRDYISVQDVANAIVCAIDYNNSDIINIGSGVGYSVLEIIEIIENIVGIKVELNFLNKREIDQPILIADAAKAIKKLGWKPTKDLVQIIKDTQNGLYL